MWAHLTRSNERKKKKKKEKRGGQTTTISPSCFRGTPATGGCWLKKQKDKGPTNNNTKEKKREERGQKRQNKSRAPSSESEAKRR